jgi:hypothetical protein
VKIWRMNGNSPITKWPALHMLLVLFFCVAEP